MPDITMCVGEGCPLKEECFRYTAKPSEYRQSYFDGTPNYSRLRCEYFMYNGKK